MKLVLTALLSATLLGCATTSEEVSPIDQIPMYGEMDRSSVPELRAGDQWFIEGATKEFGSREKASKYFSDYGVRMHLGGNSALGMKRCNQAWLLDPNNFDAH